MPAAVSYLPIRAAYRAGKVPAARSALSVMVVQRQTPGSFPNWPMRAALASCLAAGLIMLASAAQARIIQVGPQEGIKTIAAAAQLARDDDVVEIASGDYEGDVAVWLQKRLTIRGVGQRPVLSAAGNSAEGKAIWVIRNGDFYVSNIEFRGARVADGNGAGIRFERGKLKIAHCVFLDNQMGILTAGFKDAELTIEGSVFAQAPKQDRPLPHLLYVGGINLLRVFGSRFHGGYQGHLLKSRARVSDIRYSLLVDGEGGSASYEAEFPNGGDVTLIGNVIGQSSTTRNPIIVAYGAEGSTWPLNRLRMVHNTLYSEGWRPAWFLHVFKDKIDAPLEIMTRNNLLVGSGLFTTNLTGQHQGNYFAPAVVLGDTAIMDFTLGADSWLRGLVDPIAPDPEGLQPKFEQLMPGRISAIGEPSKWAPGAMQATTLRKP